MLDLETLEAMPSVPAVRATLMKAAVMAYDSTPCDLPAMQRTITSLFAHIGYALGRLPTAKHQDEEAGTSGIWHCAKQEAEFKVIIDDPAMPTLEHYFATLRAAEKYFEEQQIKNTKAQCQIWAKMAY